ncbi:MAG: SDR family oxidoreductase [Acidobacteriota bacterium]|nr:MAG: SDR family oxidoreductase [Acidobacteriota bacterium]
MIGLFIQGGLVSADANRKTVLITGTSSGIGLAAAERLATAGYRVFGTVRREQDAGPLERAGGEPVLMDVTDAESIEAARHVVEQRLDGRPLAGLINNAGIATGGPWELVPLERVRSLFDVNFFGVVAVTKAFLPALRAARARIVMISSISGRLAGPFMGPYASSKFALEAFSDSLRRELAPHGVEIVVIQPGPITTPIWAKAREQASHRLERGVYEAALSEFQRQVERAVQTALPASDVAEEALRALEARRPPTRLLVAHKATLLRLFSFLPDRWMDRLISARWRR